MPGAVRLSGEACLRSGAGLVTVATHPGNAAAVVPGRPELMCHEVSTAAELKPLIDAADIVAIGPGLGRDEWACTMFGAVLESDKPLVVDADGLNLLSGQHGARAIDPALLSRPCRNRVLTPHPGEAARLLGKSTADIQSDRLSAGRDLVARYGGIVVLKGAGTLVCSAGRTPALCDRGNPGMASAGMGDVLTGITAALLAQIGDPWDAVRCAVFAHALAGDAAAQGGERGLIASDVIANLRACLNPTSSN